VGVLAPAGAALGGVSGDPDGEVGAVGVTGCSGVVSVMARF
jgi:hypothetical protein